METTGPTLSARYNRVLAGWRASGHDSKPECEDCGCDLTGKTVKETRTNWLCEVCWMKPETYASSEPREDFHADLGR